MPEKEQLKQCPHCKHTEFNRTTTGSEDFTVDLEGNFKVTATNDPDPDAHFYCNECEEELVYDDLVAL